MSDGYDVFLSHNSRDKPVVEEIAALLEKQGLRVWLDKWELRPGFPWQEGLEKGIQASRAGAVFVGVEGLGSWQEPEMRAFIARSRREKIPVIPVLLPGCPESPQLTVFLDAFTWVDLREGLTEEGLARLVWGITGKKPEGKGVAEVCTAARIKAAIKAAKPQGKWWKWGIAMLVLALTLLWLWLCLPVPPKPASKMLLVARDLEDHPLSGFYFSYGGFESQATKQTGSTELNLPPGQGPGQQIRILLVHHSKQTEDWMLVNPHVNIPTGSGPAEVVLMRRSVFLQIAAEARDAPGTKADLRSNKKSAAEDLKPVLADAAVRRGLTAEQLESAIQSFAETPDPKDRGIAAYLEGQYQQAEELLDSAGGSEETLLYLGATQYQQAKYRAAADSFHKALALHSENPALLNWLGRSLRALAAWTEAEPPLRRALAINEKSYGPKDPKVATALNNLASLLQATNRLAEAEPLLRRALAIDEKSYGPIHPEVAIDLNNLALLLQDTNRLAEAEPLMRRVLAIIKNRYGPEDPNVATALNNLALLLLATNHLAEAEPLLRRALAIVENRYQPEHPKVATALGSLALLLQATNRLAEAEPLMRRALAIDEKSYGPEHPEVATDLNSLALLLQATNRLTEAEPLMQRALAIDEKSYGPEHPNVARDLNSLALLFKDTKRLPKAELLMRRALAILHEFSRRTGYEHPNQEKFSANYRNLLQAMGKSPAEIEETIKALK